jgi:CTP-dependent riboflavin kinase
MRISSGLGEGVFLSILIFSTLLVRCIFVEPFLFMFNIYLDLYDEEKSISEKYRYVQIILVAFTFAISTFTTISQFHTLSFKAICIIC